MEPFLPGELPSFTYQTIADGAAGTRQTLNAMARFARQFKSDPFIRAIARQIVAPVPGKSYMDEADAIQTWVRAHVRYTGDVCDLETVQSPRVTLDELQGDCDDHATLVAALLMAVNHPARFSAWALQAPGEYEHVVAETMIGNRWVSVETTENVGLGWLPDTPFPPMIVSV